MTGNGTHDIWRESLMKTSNIDFNGIHFEAVRPTIGVSLWSLSPYVSLSSCDHQCSAITLGLCRWRRAAASPAEPNRCDQPSWPPNRPGYTKKFVRLSFRGIQYNYLCRQRPGKVDCDAWYELSWLCLTTWHELYSFQKCSKDKRHSLPFQAAADRLSPGLWGMIFL